MKNEKPFLKLKLYSFVTVLSYTCSFGCTLHCILYIVHWLLVLANLLYLTSFLRGSHLLPSQLPGKHTGCCLIWQTHLVKPLTIITCLSLVLEELEALWLGTNPMVHRWSLMCANHIDMIAHPSLFYQVGYHSYIYVECSTVGSSHILHYGAMLAGWSPIHVLTGLMIS